MKLFSFSKDGGPESKVSGFFFVEIKKLFSVVLLRFGNGSREAFHDHAFNCISWVLKGKLREKMIEGGENIYKTGLKPIITKRSTFHQVFSEGTTWVFSIRGPWSKTWQEFLPDENRKITLTHGRKEVENV